MTESLKLSSSTLRMATDHVQAARRALTVTYETYEGDQRDPWMFVTECEFDNARGSLTEAISQLQRALDRVNAKQIEMLKQQLAANA